MKLKNNIIIYLEIIINQINIITYQKFSIYGIIIQIIKFNELLKSFNSRTFNYYYYL